MVPWYDRGSKFRPGTCFRTYSWDSAVVLLCLETKEAEVENGFRRGLGNVPKQVDNCSLNVHLLFLPVVSGFWPCGVFILTPTPLFSPTPMGVGMVLSRTRTEHIGRLKGIDKSCTYSLLGKSKSELHLSARLCMQKVCESLVLSAELIL